MAEEAEGKDDEDEEEVSTADLTLKFQQDLDSSFQSTVFAAPDRSISGRNLLRGKVIRPFPLKEGGREEIVVTHIESPSKFWVITKKGEHARSKFRFALTNAFFVPTVKASHIINSFCRSGLLDILRTALTFKHLCITNYLQFLASPFSLKGQFAIEKKKSALNFGLL